MSALLFYDPVCAEPYDTRSLRVQAMGGAEASLVRVADALGAWVVQHNRTAAYGRYRPPERLPEVAHVVVNRESRALAVVRTLYPNARAYLWLHDRLSPFSKRGRRLAATAPLLRDMAVGIVCVSDSQRLGVEATLRGMGVQDRVTARTIYNPVDDELVPDGSPVDDRKLVFFSSPNKGLKYALDAFRALRRRMPDLKLLVGNPGYRTAAPAAIEGVEYLGALPQQRIHCEVRTALCTFFPNFVIPETFGLVFAESKAIGTPVLTHDCGAALEVLADPLQVLPVSVAQRCYEACVSGWSTRWRSGPARVAAALGVFDAYAERIQTWRAGMRPVVGPDPRFRLGAITQQWSRLLL